jgi:hypothetical protein
LANGGLHQIRIERHHIPHEQTTIRATLDSQASWLGNVALEKVLSDRCEVFVATQAIILQGCLMPSRPVLATTTDVRHNIDATLSQPSPAGPRVVAGLQRDLKAAVSIEQRRVGSIQFQAFLGDHEVRDLRSVFARREMLGDFQAARIKKGR